jgi:hypothetical protein
VVKVRWSLAGWAAVSARHSGQADVASVADGADVFQGHVAAALGGPFVGLLDEYGAGDANEDGPVGQDADDVGAALDLAIEKLDSVAAVSGVLNLATLVLLLAMGRLVRLREQLR